MRPAGVFRKRWLAGIALLVTVIATLGFFWPFRQSGNDLRLPGVVEIQEVRLGSKVGGRVARVSVNEGDLLAAGKELVVIEMPEMEAQREQWAARVAAAEADLAKARNGPRPEELRQADSDLEAAEADLRLASEEFSRVERLYRTSASARAEFDTARATRNRAQGRYGMAKARLDLLRAGTRQEEIAMAQARLAEMRGKLHEIEANLHEAVVRAPERCVVDVLAVRKGDLVVANQPVARVLRADDLWVKVYVPETQLGRVRLNDQARVTIDSYPGRVFEGTVSHIGAESEFTPRNVQSVDERRHQVFGVKVRIAQPQDPKQGVFKSGMAAEVTLPLQGPSS